MPPFARIRRLGLWLSCLALFGLNLTLLRHDAFSQAISLPKATPPLPEALMAWSRQQATLPDIAVTFRQTRTIPALKQPVSAHGCFWRFQDGSFRWELGSPAETVLVHDQKEFRVRETPQGEWKNLLENDVRYRMWARFLSGREASPQEMTRHFIIQQSEDSPDATTVTLRPKAPMVRRHLRQLDLQISRSNARLLQLRVVQGDSSTLLMQFDEPRNLPSGEKAKILAK